MSTSARRLAALLAATTTSALLLAASGGSAPALVATGATLQHGAALDGAEIVPGQVIVRYAAGTTPAERRGTVRAQRAVVAETLEPRTELVDLPGGASVEDAIAAFEDDPDVAYAEPNYVYRIAAPPDDPDFTSGLLWGLHKVSAPAAWDLTTGSSSVVVAVIDSGVAYDHPDLAANIWTNPGEIPGNGIDDDGNSKIDDTRGWDFFANDNTPFDANGHGTHVAGTIGARGNNNIGITGVNWQVSIMPLRAGDASGGLTSSAIIGAIQYACAKGARVVNGSFVGDAFSGLTLDAINSAPCANTLFVFAAGNGGPDFVGDDNDLTPQYPCNYNTARIVCVAATTDTDARAAFSNFGVESVDLAAPGVAIRSSIPTFATVGVPDGFENTPTLFSTRWGGQTAPGGHPLWGQENVAQAGAFGLSDSPSGNYSPNTDTHIRSLTGTNLSGKAGCSLTYWLRLATETNFDFFTIEASTAFAGAYSDVSQGGWSGSTIGTAFVKLQEDLGAFDGQSSVFLRFRLRSNGTNELDGAHVDDISLDCLTTPPAGGEYKNDSGTSMAAPHVAGVAALVLARNPALTTAGLRSVLLTTVDPVAGLTGLVATGGRLNARRAVEAALDTTPPPVPAIVSGPSGTVTKTVATFLFTNTEIGVAFECRRDGAPFAPCTSPVGFTALTQGPHTFDVRARDAAGNTSAAASRTWTIDTIAPNTKITSGRSARTTSRTATFKFSSTESATFKCKLDAGAWRLCKSPKTYRNLKKGSHTFRVVAIDRAGNADPTPAKKTWKIA